MNNTSFYFAFTIIITLLTFIACSTPPSAPIKKLVQENIIIHPKDTIQFNTSLIKRIKQTIRTEQLNQQYAFIVRFDIHSGYERMFLYDLQQKQIIDHYMCAHGSGCGECEGTPCKFSNISRSYCSSEGMGYVHTQAESNWGNKIKYWVKGLDSTNNNMENRIVVMHSYEEILDTPIYPEALTNSLGCFMTSIEGMNRIDNFIQSQANKKIALYSYKAKNKKVRTE